MGPPPPGPVGARTARPCESPAPGARGFWLSAAGVRRCLRALGTLAGFSPLSPRPLSPLGREGAQGSPPATAGTRGRPRRSARRKAGHAPADPLLPSRSAWSRCGLDNGGGLCYTMAAGLPGAREMRLKPKDAKSALTR